jgi:hypothetical protein
MKKVLFITFLSFFVFLTSGYSKSKITKDSTVTNVTSWGKNKIGVTYSMMTGSGMSYWREINEKFAFKTQIFGYGTTEVENKYDNSIIASFGLELQFQLNKTERTKLYLLSGAYYSYNNEMNYYYRRKFIDDYKEYLSNFGAGFGFEVLALKNLSFSIDGGYFIGFKNVREYYENEDLTIYKNPFSFG